jgi:hypothetical protein
MEDAPDILAMQDRIYRRMTGEQRLAEAAKLSWAAREIKAAGLRAQHPDWTEERIQKKVMEVFRCAYT